MSLSDVQDALALTDLTLLRKLEPSERHTLAKVIFQNTRKRVSGDELLEIAEREERLPVKQRAAKHYERYLREYEQEFERRHQGIEKKMKESAEASAKANKAKKEKGEKTEKKNKEVKIEGVNMAEGSESAQEESKERAKDGSKKEPRKNWVDDSADISDNS